MPDQPSDQQLDARLAQMASAALADHAADIDSAGELDELQARLAERPVAGAPVDRSSAGRWLAAAAAAVLVIGGVVAIVWTQSGDDDTNTAALPQSAEPAPVSGQDTVTTLPLPAASTVTTAAPETTGLISTVPPALTAPPAARASAEPSTVGPGGSFTITPSATIERACDGWIRTSRQDGADAGQFGAISLGTWFVIAADEVGVPDCAGVQSVTDEPLTIAIPRNMPPGTYDLCLTTSREPAGCAQVAVTAVAGEATADPATVTVGEVVTITPVGVVQRACQDVVTAIQLDNAAGSHGQLVDGQWLPAPAGNITVVTYPTCEGDLSDAAVQVMVPVDMPTGLFALCLVEQASFAVQSNPNPGCAVVAIKPLPLPVCWTEPMAPPTLGDGSAPGDTVIDEAGWAVWGDVSSPAAVRQKLRSEPNSWWLDEPLDGVPQVSNGSVRAAVAAGGDFAEAPKVVLVRGPDGCDREYYTGLTSMDEAVALAQAWVDALALAA